MGHGTLQTVLVVKAVVMDIPIPYSFLHQIMCARYWDRLIDFLDLIAT